MSAATEAGMETAGHAARQAMHLMMAGRLEEALACADEALAGVRSLIPVHGLRANLLLQLGREEAAVAGVNAASALPPDPRLAGDAYDALAFVALHAGQHEYANALYRKAVQHAPRDAQIWYNFASSERSFGRLHAAEEACDRAVAIDTEFFQAYILRAELRTQSDERNHVAELARLFSRPGIPDRSIVFLGYALGKELDDLGHYPEAFACFERAAKARRRQLKYDVATDEGKLARIRDRYSQRVVEDTAPARDSHRYVFIVGLPRSGTTLLERILSNLAGVRTNGETDRFSRALFAGAPPDSDPFEYAMQSDAAAVGDRYRRLADRGYASGSVIEKLPMNTLYVGAIHRALPLARIVWVTRAPLDHCFAMWRTLFGAGYPFTYEFSELARYYAACERLRAHWHAVLPGHLHEVAYEHLVQDPLDIARKTAEFCGLAWEDGAIDILRNVFVSTTASASQIRQPIYRSAVGRAHRYHAHLKPLRSALAGADVNFD